MFPRKFQEYPESKNTGPWQNQKARRALQAENEQALNLSYLYIIIDNALS
jgi:hypothetical protein